MINSAMHYFNAKGSLDLILLLLNGGLASAIFAVLLFARMHEQGTSVWTTRFARFVLVAAYGVLALRVWAGWYFTPVEPTHVAVNAIVLWVVWAVRGDVSVILAAFDRIRSDRTSS